MLIHIAGSDDFEPPNLMDPGVESEAAESEWHPPRRRGVQEGDDDGDGTDLEAEAARLDEEEENDEDDEEGRDVDGDDTAAAADAASAPAAAEGLRREPPIEIKEESDEEAAEDERPPPVARGRRRPRSSGVVARDSSPPPGPRPTAAPDQAPSRLAPTAKKRARLGFTCTGCKRFNIMAPSLEHSLLYDSGSSDLFSPHARPPPPRPDY